MTMQEFGHLLHHMRVCNFKTSDDMIGKQSLHATTRYTWRSTQLMVVAFSMVHTLQRIYSTRLEVSLLAALRAASGRL